MKGSKPFECITGADSSEVKKLPSPLTAPNSVGISHSDDKRLFPSSTTHPKEIVPANMPPILARSSSPCSPEGVDFVNEFGTGHTHLSNLAYSNLFNRRQRGEKRPIPDEQKDEKYYERRKRNNEAAKKSRDARKLREDRIAFRAAILEHENAILRAQVMALRDEMATLRQMMDPRVPSISLNL